MSAVTSGLGVYRVTENEGIGAIARGVDVSYWQQNVNWSQVASDNVQFAMLATRFRGNVDPFFAMNAANAARQGCGWARTFIRMRLRSKWRSRRRILS